MRAGELLARHPELLARGLVARGRGLRLTRFGYQQLESWRNRRRALDEKAEAQDEPTDGDGLQSDEISPGAPDDILDLPDELRRAPDNSPPWIAGSSHASPDRRDAGAAAAELSGDASAAASFAEARIACGANAEAGEEVG